MIIKTKKTRDNHIFKNQFPDSKKKEPLLNFTHEQSSHLKILKT